MDTGTSTQLRLDKWLFFARILKSREKAAQLIKDGAVRVNSVRFETPSKLIKTGDVLTIALERQIMVIKIMQLGTRRGPASEAAMLYERLAEV